MNPSRAVLDKRASIGGEGGFSILEVLVTVLILGVAASIVGVNVDRTLESVRRREALSQVARFIDQARLASLERAAPIRLQDFLERDQAWTEREDLVVQFSDGALIHAHGACAASEANVTYRNRRFVLAIAPLTCRIDPA